MSKILQKYDVLQQLLALGVDTPASFVVDRVNYFDVLRSLNRHSKVEYWVVRASLEDKHLINQPAYASTELDSVFNEVFSIKPDCKLLVTQLIPAIRAGIFIKARDFIYCEHVPGALQSLARDGVKPNRVLLEPSGHISFIEPNVPEFSYCWSGSNLEIQHKPDAETISSIEGLIEKLLPLLARCPQFSIIEWVQSPNKHLYAIDFKRSESEFLGRYQDIYHGLLNGCLISLPALVGKSTLSIKEDLGNAVMFIERPLYQYITDGSAFSASGIVLRTGGLLAHLIVECSHRFVPCIMSTTLFDLNRGGPVKIKDSHSSLY